MPSVEIPYGSTKHARILQEIRGRFLLSRIKMAERYAAWEKVDKLYQAFQPATNEDLSRASKRDQGLPQYTTLHVPYSYATLLAAHTYWASVFLARTPVQQFTGRHGETQMKVQAVEALMDYQTMVGEHLVPFYIWLLDTGKYGFGAVGNYWAEEKSWVTKLVEQPVTFMGMQLADKTKVVKQRELVRGYSGNRLFNIRPYEFFPDPRVSLTNFQKGEFCGHLAIASWNDILKKKESGSFFNVEELERKWSSGSLEKVHGSSVLNMPLTDPIYQPEGGNGKGPFELVDMVVELVPNAPEWGLGNSSYPEKWAFTMAANCVIVGCEPLGLDHNKYPYAVMTYEVDGYSQTSRGMMEIIEPLNHAMTWLVNSHFFNVRKALNDQLVVDPRRVVMKDLTDGGPGRIIRLSPSAYGTDVRTAVTQLQVMDVTQRHLGDTQILSEIIQRVTGVTDNILGLVNPGGRKTATEVRTSSSFGVNRLKTFAEFNSALGFGPLAAIMLQNTQQMYDLEQQFRVAGDLIQAGGTGGFLQVTPEAIQGFYDFVPVDGTMPIDRFAIANLWKEILTGLVKMPQLAAGFDLVGIFSWMAQQAGLKNINQFKIKVSPDQQIQQQLQAGNLVPPQAGGIAA